MGNAAPHKEAVHYKLYQTRRAGNVNALYNPFSSLFSVLADAFASINANERGRPAHDEYPVRNNPI
jgi:hypothetical protein